LGTVDCTTSFAYYRLIIDPTNSVTFPWLSPIARTFQQWKPLGVVFEFIPTCGTAISSTNPAMGVIASKTSYNVDALPPGTMSEVLNSHFATSGAPYQSQMTAVECAEASQPFKWWKIRADIGPPSPEEQLYAFATQYYATTGGQTNYTAGQLWVSYDIMLTQPRLDTGANLLQSPEKLLGDHTPAPPPSRDGGEDDEEHRYEEARSESNFVRVESRSHQGRLVPSY
jgi:hypothetical protein